MMRSPVITPELLETLRACAKDPQAFETLSALFASSVTLTHILEALFLFGAVLSPAGRVLQVNQTALDMAGLSQVEVLNQRFEKTYWFGHSTRLQADMVAILEQAAQGKATRCDVRLQMGADIYVPLDVVVVPISDANDTVRQIVVCGYDLSKRAAVEDALKTSEALLRSATEHYPNSAVFMFDRDLRYLLVAGENLGATDSSRQRLEGRTLYEVFPPETAAMVEGDYRATLAGQHITREYTVDGQTFLIATHPIHDDTGSIIAGMLVAHDITDHRRTIQREFEWSLEQERIRILSEFIRNASHEFRTPLSIIQSSAYLLNRVDDPQRKDDHVAKINQQVEAITDLIDDLVMMVSLDDEMHFERERVRVNMLIRQVVDTMRARLQNERLQIRLELGEDLPPVKGDSTKLGLALKNVIENAIQYSPAESQMTIRSSLHDQRVVIEVEDQGMGITEQALPHIFERFYRTEHTRSGLGLGLPITKKIIERHRGQITVESSPGQGSRFRLMLPVG